MNKISLVVSDVDGTLVTPDKQLTDAAVRAVELLRGEGIEFTINSSSPANPTTVVPLVNPLRRTCP